jgi:acetyltransferase-like isoleucine patch superfamily enzyme
MTKTVLGMNGEPFQNYDLTKFKKVGEDVVVDPTVQIKHPGEVSLGSHVAIDFGFYLTTKAKIGDFIHIGPYVSAIGGLVANLELQDLTSVAAGVRFICLGSEHGSEGIVGALIPNPYKDKLIGGEIVIEKFAAIGTNAVLMPGLRMGEGSVLGANSLLRNDAEPWTVYAGSPAVPIKKRNNVKILNYAKEMGY